MVVVELMSAGGKKNDFGVLGKTLYTPPIFVGASTFHLRHLPKFT
jgi:hypothetical protein